MIGDFLNPLPGEPIRIVIPAPDAEGTVMGLQSFPILALPVAGIALSLVALLILYDLADG